MKESGLLRWGQVIDGLQELVMRGDLGQGRRLYQLPGGDWQIINAPDETLTFLEHRLEGTFFYPSAAVTLDGEPAFLDGVPVDADEPPSKELSFVQIAGPTTVYLSATRPTEDDLWTQPGVILFANGLISGGSLLELFQPLAIIRQGTVLTISTT